MITFRSFVIISTFVQYK